MIRKLLNSPFHFTGSFKLGIACHFPEPSNLFLCGHGIARKNQLIQRNGTNCLINKDFSTYPAHLPLCYACEPRQLNLPEAVTYLFLDEQSEFLLVVGSISVLDEVGAFVDRGEQSLKERKMLKILNDFFSYSQHSLTLYQAQDSNQPAMCSAVASTGLKLRLIFSSMSSPLNTKTANERGFHQPRRGQNYYIY